MFALRATFLSPPPGQNPVYASELNIVFKGSFYDLTKKETSLWLQEIVHIKKQEV